MDSGESYEQQHVHSVYNSIASHFSQTRYKPWPIVERFLKDQRAGGIGVDIGCGNGKYLNVRDDVFIIGSDRSDELVKIAAQQERHDAIIGDALLPPHPNGHFDFAISIAVLHHLSTRERRVEGVRALLSTLKCRVPSANGYSGHHKEQKVQLKQSHNNGQALIFVWALEQKDSRRGWEEGGKQDVLVPWVLKPPQESSKQGRKTAHEARRKTKDKGKADDTEVDAQQPSVQETDHAGPAQGKSTDNLQNETSGSLPSNGRNGQPDGDNVDKEEAKTPKIFQRYYHLYRQGELEEDVIAAGGKVVQHGYDRDNWWCIATRGS